MNERDRAIAARRQSALDRPELRHPSAPRAHGPTAGATSFAAKLKDPALVDMINRAAGIAPPLEQSPGWSEPQHGPTAQCSRHGTAWKATCAGCIAARHARTVASKKARAVATADPSPPLEVADCDLKPLEPLPASGEREGEKPAPVAVAPAPHPDSTPSPTPQGGREGYMVVDATGEDFCPESFADTPEEASKKFFNLEWTETEHRELGVMSGRYRVHKVRLEDLGPHTWPEGGAE